MLFTDAKGGNLCFLNDDLHREQIQTELEMLATKLLNSLLCTGVIYINKRPTIVVTQTGTTIAEIKWASVNILSEFFNSFWLQ